jgi:hypothetical protein
MKLSVTGYKNGCNQSKTLVCNVYPSDEVTGGNGGG